MKNLSGFALFVAATLLTTVSASAQSHVERVYVPFDFTVGNATMPAGSYSISSPMSSSGLLAIGSRDHKVSTMALGQPGQPHTNRVDALAFDKVGDKYYLRDLRSSSSAMNVHFPVSKAEKKARAQVDEAGLSVHDPVLIALN